MIPQVNLKIGSDSFTLAFERSGIEVVASTDDTMTRVLKMAAQRVMRDYSPAFGSPVAFLASSLKAETGGTIVSMIEPLTEPGLVH